MQLAPIAVATVDPSDFTSPLSGAHTSISEARSMLDELADTSDAARGAVLVGDITSQVHFAAEQLGDASTSGIDAGAVASWQAARLLMDEAVETVGSLAPPASSGSTATLDTLYDLLDGAGAHVSSALDHYGV